MFNDLLKMLYPMGIVGDEDSGGSDETPQDPPAEPETTDEGNPPTPPAENEDEKPEISDDEFANLKEVLSPEQFESIQQTRAMNKRMRDKMAKLEKERQERQTPPEPKQEEPKQPVNPGEQKPFDPVEWLSDNQLARTSAVELMEETGMSKKALNHLLNLVFTGTDRIAMHRSDRAVEPLASEFQEGKLKKSLDSVSSEDDFKFAMSKTEFRKEVENLVRKDYSPKEWGNPDTIKKAFKDVFFNHRQEFASQGKREIVEDGSIHEKATGGVGSTGGVSHSALETFARERGLGDVKDPTVRKHVLEAYNLKKKIEADLKK